MADSDSSVKDLDQLSEEELDALANFGPCISDEQVEQLEKSATTHERGQQRRLAANTAHTLTTNHKVKPSRSSPLIDVFVLNLGDGLLADIFKVSQGKTYLRGYREDPPL